jgi:hypothetical protein
VGAVTGFGKVYLVAKERGVDNGALYAMKTTDIPGSPVSRENDNERCRIERYVHEIVTDAPFLVGMHYAFQTETKQVLVLGEYIKNYFLIHDV